MNISKKREHKRLRRLKVIKGRLTAFGRKSYPADVLAEIKKARERNEETDTVYGLRSNVADVERSEKPVPVHNFWSKLFKRGRVRNEGETGTE